VNRNPKSRSTTIMAAVAFSQSKPLSVAASVETPRYAIRFTLILVVILAVVTPALLLAPWRQTVYGSGQVIAFNPTQRPQFVTTAVEGVIVKWHVYEGQRVKKGQRLVQLRDNDPDVLQRLTREKKALDEQLRQSELRIQDNKNRVEFLKGAKIAALLQADSVILATEAEARALVNARGQVLARVEVAKFQDTRTAELVIKNDVSQREREQAIQELKTSKEALGQADELITAANKRVEAALAFRKQTEEANNALIAQGEGDIKLVTGARDAMLGQIEIFSTKYARQDNLDVFAPTDGTVFRLLANGEGNQFVRAQERLARIVPDVPPNLAVEEAKLPAMQAASGGAGMAAYRALTELDVPAIVAELNIDGNDLPLLKQGDRVLLQFEGWAAVQFAAYPNAATGTFEGRVYLVDPTADDKGLFRVLVEPALIEPTGRPADPWPNQELLRQGVRAQGWFLLEEVRVGLELWRLLNGFPVARPLDEKSAGSSLLGPVKSTGGQ